MGEDFQASSRPVGAAGAHGDADVPADCAPLFLGDARASYAMCARRLARGRTGAVWIRGWTVGPIHAPEQRLNSLNLDDAI